MLMINRYGKYRSKLEAAAPLRPRFKHPLLFAPIFLNLLARQARIVDWLKWAIGRSVPESMQQQQPRRTSPRSKLCVRSAANRETAFPRSRRSKWWKLYYSLRTTIKRNPAARRRRRRPGAPGTQPEPPREGSRPPLDLSGSRRIDGKHRTGGPTLSSDGYLIFGYHTDGCRGNWMKRGWKSKRGLSSRLPARLSQESLLLLAVSSYRESSRCD